MSNVVRILSVFLVCSVVVALAGCSKKEEPSQSSSEQQPAGSSAAPASGQATAQTDTPAMPPADMDFDKMTAEQAAALKQMNQGKDIEPISLDALKGFLPAALAGMKRGETDARQMGMMGIKTAMAQADYETGDGSSTLNLMIMDVGNASGPMRMGLTGWTIGQVDQQTDTSYEKTITYQGYKGLEKYDRQDQHGEFRIFVVDRFVVEVTGDNVTIETIKKAMGQIDLKKLVSAAK